MNAYVEVHDQTGTDYYYASLEIKGQRLSVQRHQGLYKVREKELALTGIHDLAVNGSEDRQIKFSYGKDTFIFFDSGSDIVRYLYHQLLTA
ncbi:hypothetical protein [Candidatus Enterococcus ferrettii]|uniref:Uncharacterized protein n=1 Tax=Candidatus Enterococcus ferrettii TaxID=2815324 RepID=A0ABV0EWZ2_9ENTE|nr:hypothetical protein [Enterococcus sp. 665A]MBO1338732.1 hypothetical protein [Enterococcus sp. 665A]